MHVLYVLSVVLLMGVFLGWVCRRFYFGGGRVVTVQYYNNTSASSVCVSCLILIRYSWFLGFFANKKQPAVAENYTMIR